MYSLLLVSCMLHFCNCFDAPSPSDEIFIVNFDSGIYPYGDESYAWVNLTDIEVERYNESVAFMQGDIIVKKLLDGNVCMEVILCKEMHGGDFQEVFSVDVDVCEELAKKEQSQYYKFLKYIDVSPPCPIKPGKYPIRRYCIDKNDLGEISNSHVGRYEARAVISTGDNCAGVDKEYLYTLKIDIIVERAE